MVLTVVSIPDGLANGLLAGVNPILSLYLMIAATMVSALFTSSVIMNVDSDRHNFYPTIEVVIEAFYQEVQSGISSGESE